MWVNCKLQIAISVITAIFVQNNRNLWWQMIILLSHYTSPVSALPNTRLFVSHCGMNGVMESVFHKVTRDFVLSKIIIFNIFCSPGASGVSAHIRWPARQCSPGPWERTWSCPGQVKKLNNHFLSLDILNIWFLGKFQVLSDWFLFLGLCVWNLKC